MLAELVAHNLFSLHIYYNYLWKNKKVQMKMWAISLGGPGKISGWALTRPGPPIDTLWKTETN